MMNKKRRDELTKRVSQLEDELRNSHEAEVQSGNWRSLALDVLLRISASRLEMSEKFTKTLDRVAKAKTDKGPE